MEDIQSLGGNIELKGFKDLDGGSMIILKKMVGTHARNLLNNNKTFDKLCLNLKKMVLAGNRVDSIFALEASIVSGAGTVTKEVQHNNLFVALDTVLKQINL